MRLNYYIHLDPVKLSNGFLRQLTLREVVSKCRWNNYRLVLNWIERVEERVVLWKGRHNLKENVFFEANGST